jgi:hypothetical protein
MYLSVVFSCCRIEDTLEYASTAASRALTPTPDNDFGSGLTWSSSSMRRLPKVLNFDRLNRRSNTNGAFQARREPGRMLHHADVHLLVSSDQPCSLPA